MLRMLLWPVCLLGFFRSGLLAADEPAPRPPIADFAWLAGTWSLEANGRVVTEQWLPLAGGTMLGVSRTIAGDRTVAYEFVVLRAEASGRLVYEAHPSGQEPAAFELVRWDGTEVVFENAGHDFPQRVIYRRSGDDQLLAAIEGTKDGRTRRVEFPYRRVKE